jgi:DNA-binding IclR family transcriptional regulator
MAAPACRWPPRPSGAPGSRRSQRLSARRFWSATQRGISRAIDEHRTLGVTCSFGEWLTHVNGIACAVHPGQDLPPMAISCGGPAARLSPQFLLGEVRPRLIAMVARIEEALQEQRPGRHALR